MPETVLQEGKYMITSEDKLADYAARALLLPAKEISECLQAQNYTSVSTRKRVKIVKTLCKAYQVDEIMMLRRIKKIQILGEL